MRSGLLASLAFFALLGLATLCSRADRLVLSDGRILEGDVIADDDDALTIETTTVSSTLCQRLDKTQVRTWFRSPRQGQR